MFWKALGRRFCFCALQKNSWCLFTGILYSFLHDQTFGQSVHLVVPVQRTSGAVPPQRVRLLDEGADVGLVLVRTQASEKVEGIMQGGLQLAAARAVEKVGVVREARRRRFPFPLIEIEKRERKR